MIRFVTSLLVLAAIASGCVVAAEDVGSTRSASSTSYSVSTRSPVADDTIVTVTANVGRPGVVPAGDEGVCWITRLSGSFRGANEFARILIDPSGYYYAAVRSTTAYDSVAGVGPAMTMKCRHLTDFMDASDVSDFAVQFNSVSINSTTDAGTNFVSAVTMATAGSLWPWAGVDGRLDTAAVASYNTATANKSLGGLYVSVAKSCPLSQGIFCSVLSSAWETYSVSGTRSWVYEVTSATANNDADITLSNAAASTMECFLDGANGEWNSGTSAEVQVQADGRWHLVTVKGGGGGMGARASCVKFAQGF